MLINYSAHQSKQVQLAQNTCTMGGAAQNTDAVQSSTLCRAHSAKHHKKYTLLMPLHKGAGKQRAQKDNRRVGPLSWWVRHPLWHPYLLSPQAHATLLAPSQIICSEARTLPRSPFPSFHQSCWKAHVDSGSVCLSMCVSERYFIFQVLWLISVTKISFMTIPIC